MARYSIRKQGCAYVVFAGEHSVLSLKSRRQAAKLIADAMELLSVQSLLPEAGMGADQSPVSPVKFLDAE
jgi:hypothetical protein